jgi:hypothetical protein
VHRQTQGKQGIRDYRRQSAKHEELRARPVEHHAGQNTEHDDRNGLQTHCCEHTVKTCGVILANLAA